MPITAGSTVELQTGGPPMTLMNWNAERGGYECAWFPRLSDGTFADEAKHDFFPATALKVISEPGS